MPDDVQPDALGAAAAALARLGTRGARRIDPVRWHLAEALARRAPLHAGAARRVIEERLGQVVEALAEALDREELSPSREDSAMGSNPGPLAALVAHAGAHGKRSPAPPIEGGVRPEARPLAPVAGPSSRTASRASGARSRAPVAAPVPPAHAEPPGLQYFRRMWSRLNADTRLAQSHASLPANAGPLNSHHLVHRALVTLHELAPGYLEHFVAHVDDLLWIEAAIGEG